MQKNNFGHDFVDKMKNLLLEAKKEILNSIKSVEASKREIISNDMHLKDVVDIAFDNMDGNNLEALSFVEQKKLHLINQALYRISKSTYGKCLACDKDIAKERLEAIPYAFLCISCQTRKEKKSRR
ncbi:molecular chaperone DnaK [Candidatus Borreliella tachyglossi]|uniref:Molecular chaperone DnaK n=1 Tax=Candidatus Borreliella tachyglossi TaxID=1964448 RepID=A0A2S1LW79_9SPIR|nr:TraR/DksA family transcriptional regulator [Candidatus Borreliella tachyglossi]AWG42559.1 molecular chaperone DnaK [Candidatus Borreliella tachyglossi]